MLLNYTIKRLNTYVRKNTRLNTKNINDNKEQVICAKDAVAALEL